MLLIAAILTFAVGAAHSWLGERYVLSRLLRRENLPKLLGSDRFTKQTLRFAWHLTTLAWWGFAALLLVIASPVLPPDRRAILLCVSLTFAASAILTGVYSRGRHFAWIAFLAIAVLCWLAR